MGTLDLDSTGIALYAYKKQNIRDNTLDDAQLEVRCPLDNGRHDCTLVPQAICHSTNQLDRLPVELLVEILLQLDIPSLTRFRCLSRRGMALVNALPQYTAILKHCPNIIRAIVSIQADGFDCGTLYRTLCTSQCSTCNQFGDHLYLIDCRRTCYLCYITRPEFFPLSSREACRLFSSSAKRQDTSPRKLLELVKVPSILSLPGRYCSAWTSRGGNLQPKRIRLYDRQAVVQYLEGGGLPQSDKGTREPKRFMAIITAPVLLNGGRQVDRGLFCRGCEDDIDERGRHFRIKYTVEGLAKHIARYGQVKEMPLVYGRFMHVIREQATL